jgi:purine-binding chemotaxis protein CheW
MSSETAASMTEPSASSASVMLSGQSSDLVTFSLGDQVFGIPVLQVQDVLSSQKVARVPLAPPQVSGAINLRGRIAVTINVRRCLNLPVNENDKSMFIVVEQKGELYSLMVDRVGDVMSLPQSDFEANPINLDPQWLCIAGGIFRLPKQLLVVLDITRLLDLVHDQNGEVSSKP